MRTSLLLILFICFVGCSSAQKTVTITKKEYLKYELPNHYDIKNIPINIHKRIFENTTYILMDQNDFIKIYKQHQELKHEYEFLYNSIQKFNLIKE